MKRIALLIFCVVAGFTVPASARVHVSFDFFFESLSPYGEWVTAGDYGPVWHPADVDEDWTPYTDGYWTYTDAGWTWVSYEDWGGITYHYGRWLRLGGYGWCWVPGYDWGPAWVSWRKSDDYVGWAPLPPEACWDRGTGFSIWVDTEFDIGPSWFRFCRVRDFGAPFIRPVLLPCERNFAFIHQTFNITNITYRKDRGCIFNHGPDYGWLAPLTALPVPALKLVRHTSDVFVPGARGNVFINAPRGNTLVVAAPPVLPGAPLAPIRAPAVARSFPAPRIDRGWLAPVNGPSLDPIRAAFKQQTSGITPRSAPARPFRSDLVAVVPKKADPKARLAIPPPGGRTPLPQPQPAAAPARPALAIPAAPASTGIPQISRSGATPQIPAPREKKIAPPVPAQPAVSSAGARAPIVAPQSRQLETISGLRDKGRSARPSPPAIAAPPIAPVPSPSSIGNRSSGGRGNRSVPPSFIVPPATPRTIPPSTRQIVSPPQMPAVPRQFPSIGQRPQVVAPRAPMPAPQPVQIPSPPITGRSIPSIVPGAPAPIAPRGGLPPGRRGERK